MCSRAWASVRDIWRSEGRGGLRDGNCDGDDDGDVCNAVLG